MRWQPLSLPAIGQARTRSVPHPGEETAEREDELERYNLASRSHGLVALDQAGEAVVTIAGHRFGRPEIELAIGQALQP